MEFDQLLEQMREMDSETHYHPAEEDPTRSYRTDFANPRRVLTGREAADIYEGLQQYDNLVLTDGFIEEDPSELVTIVDGKRESPASSSHFRLSVWDTSEGKTRVLTFSMGQLPESYVPLFVRWLETDANEQRTKAAGLRPSLIAYDGPISAGNPDLFKEKYIGPLLETETPPED